MSLCLQARNKSLLSTARMLAALSLAFIFPSCPRSIMERFSYIQKWSIGLRAQARHPSKHLPFTCLIPSNMSARSCFTQTRIIAGALDCDLNSFRVEHCPVGNEHFHTLIPGQFTVGSRCAMSAFDRYHLAGAKMSSSKIIRHYL